MEGPEVLAWGKKEGQSQELVAMEIFFPNK